MCWYLILKMPVLRNVVAGCVDDDRDDEVGRGVGVAELEEGMDDGKIPLEAERHRTVQRTHLVRECVFVLF